MAKHATPRNTLNRSLTLAAASAALAGGSVMLPASAFASEAQPAGEGTKSTKPVADSQNGKSQSGGELCKVQRGTGAGHAAGDPGCTFGHGLAGDHDKSHDNSGDGRREVDGSRPDGQKSGEHKAEDRWSHGRHAKDAEHKWNDRECQDGHRKADTRNCDGRHRKDDDCDGRWDRERWGLGLPTRVEVELFEPGRHRKPDCDTGHRHHPSKPGRHCHPESADHEWESTDPGDPEPASSAGSGYETDGEPQQAAHSQAKAVAPELAETGSSAGAGVAAAVPLLLGGAVLVAAGRRRPR